MRKYNINDYDMCLVFEPTVNEALRSTSITDPRYGAGTLVPSKDYIAPIQQFGAGSSVSFGAAIRNQLQLGAQYSTEVVDFGDAVSVKITYMNIKTGKSASQSFIILFGELGKCRVKSSATRWRSCNDFNQAVSYIRSRSSALNGKTSGNS